MTPLGDDDDDASLSLLLLATADKEVFFLDFGIAVVHVVLADVLVILIKARDLDCWRTRGLLSVIVAEKAEQPNRNCCWWWWWLEERNECREDAAKKHKDVFQKSAAVARPPLNVIPDAVNYYQTIYFFHQLYQLYTRTFFQGCYCVVMVKSI